MAHRRRAGSGVVHPFAEIDRVCREAAGDGRERGALVRSGRRQEEAYVYVTTAFMTKATRRTPFMQYIAPACDPCRTICGCGGLGEAREADDRSSFHSIVEELAALVAKPRQLFARASARMVTVFALWVCCVGRSHEIGRPGMQQANQT